MLLVLFLSNYAGADMASSPYIRSDALAVVSWLVFVVAVFFIMLLLSRGMVYKMVLLLPVYAIISAFILHDFSYGLWVFIIWILLAYQTKDLKAPLVPGKRRMFLLVFFVVLAIAAHVNFFGMYSGVKNVDRCTGFSRVVCFDLSVQGLASTRSISAVFMNRGVLAVNITNATSSGSCSIIVFRDTNLSARQETVANFTSCSGVLPQGGFSVDVSIYYTEVVDGNVSARVDRGRITGIWE